MARDAYIDNRLQNWCRWKLSQGSGALGYARVDLTEPVVDGSRDGYDAPARIPIDDVEASITDEGVRLLIPELRYTIEIYYLHPGSEETRLQKLACSKGTMHARLWRADRILSAWLAERERRAKAERRRVDALQHGPT